VSLTGETIREINEAMAPAQPPWPFCDIALKGGRDLCHRSRWRRVSVICARCRWRALRVPLCRFHLRLLRQGKIEHSVSRGGCGGRLVRLP
jgi:hypothetical protein